MTLDAGRFRGALLGALVGDCPGARFAEDPAQIPGDVVAAVVRPRQQR
jgi:hypothetical protein